MDTTGSELITQFLQQPSQRGHVRVLRADVRAGLDSVASELARAKAERRALLCLVTQVRRNLIGTDAYRPERTRPQLDALTRQWFHVGAAMELLQLLPQAAQLARSKRGPVLLEIPEDVLTERVESLWMPSALFQPSSLRFA